MRKSLFLYLFVLAVVMNIFTYMYFSKKAEFEGSTSENTTKKLRDSVAEMSAELTEARYFSLAYNENAQNYFEDDNSDQIIAYEKLIPHVREQLLNYNDRPQGNPYTGQEKIGEQKFIINKVKILNHRWIIADFSDGQYWGEVLLKYFVNDDETISFEVIQSLIYLK